MDAMTLEAIQNRLKSVNIDMGDTRNITCTNHQPIYISAYIVWSDGTTTWAGIDMTPFQSQQTSAPALPNHCYLVWLDSVSNAFVCVQYLDFEVTTDYSVLASSILPPGEIGPVPTPNTDIMVPQDSARVVVGCGLIAGGAVVRYQYWHCTTDSYVIPPGDTRTYSVTTSTGMQSTSSESDTVATSMSASTSAGWGPISASLSYSLSSSSTTTHSYTITEETTRYETINIGNTSPNIVMYIAWQMMDVVEIFLSATGQLVPSASIISARSPLIYDGPYNPAALPAPPTKRGRMSLEEQKLLASWKPKPSVLPSSGVARR